jgi:hypothetical protein
MLFVTKKERYIYRRPKQSLLITEALEPARAVRMLHSRYGCIGHVGVGEQQLFDMRITLSQFMVKTETLALYVLDPPAI